MNTAPIARLALRRSLHNRLYLCNNRKLFPSPHFITARYASTRNIEEWESEEPIRGHHGSAPPDPFVELPRIPLTTEAQRRKEQARRQHYIRRSWFAAAGVVFCGLTPLLLVQFYDLPEQMDASDSKNSEFQGRPVIVAPGGAKLVAQGGSNENDIELVPTGTSTIPHFPKTIQLPISPENPDSPTTEYTLLGLGIRSVSFLGLQVYVLGIYVKTTSLQNLQSALIHRINPTASALIPSEKTGLQTKLLDPEESYQIWDSLLRETGLHGLDTAIRIMPTRPTDFPHLRDGFVRGVTARTQDATKRQRENNPDVEPEFGDDSFRRSMNDFKALFGGRGKAPKASVLLLTRDVNGTLRMLFQREPAKNGKLELVGSVADERLSRLVWLMYLGGKNVSSEGARKSVVEGIMDIVERPIGTVETQIS